MRPLKNANTAGSPGGLAKFFRNRIWTEKTVDLLIVENNPAQRFELFFLVSGLNFPLRLAR